ncbi:MAG: acyltransferase family protein, partial [Acidimicrobiales bacterium]
LPVLGTALVIGAGCASSSRGCGRALALPPMRAIGRVSYSWYLWHWPVLLLTPPLLGHPLGLAGRLAAAIVSAGLAVLTLHYIENPVRFAAPVRRSATVSLALGGVATVIAVLTGVALLVVVPPPLGRGAAAAALTVIAAPAKAGHGIAPYDVAVQRAFAQVQTALAASADLKAVPSNLEPPLADASADKSAVNVNGCLLNYLEVQQPECATGDTASATTVALVGDSHAGMWSPSLKQVAAQRHWRLETLGKASCPLMNLPIVNPYFRRSYTECERWRGRIITRLQVEHPRLVVLGMWRHYSADYGFTSYDPVWIDSLTRLVQQLRGTGTQVLVLGPIPDPHTAVPI